MKKASLDDKISVIFKDIHTEDLTDYKDVKTLINMSFSFPILTVNKKIKYIVITSYSIHYTKLYDGFPSWIF